MKDIKVTLVQLDLKWEDPEANCTSIVRNLEGKETDLIILPEMFNTAFTMDAENNAEKLSGNTMQWMQKVAKEKHSAITGSIIIESEGSYYNRLLFCYPDGDFRHYDKRHLFRLANEHQVFEAGKEKIIVNYLGWRINLNVCYDLRFPAWSRNVNDYDILINVASWPNARIEHWKTLLKARAIENLAYCIGVNRVGSDQNNFEYSGCSSIYGPEGKCLMELANAELTETATLSKNHLFDYRAKFPFYMDQDKFTISG